MALICDIAGHKFVRQVGKCDADGQVRQVVLWCMRCAETKSIVFRDEPSATRSPEPPKGE